MSNVTHLPAARLHPIAHLVHLHHQAVIRDEELYDADGEPLVSVDLTEASNRLVCAAFLELCAAPCSSSDQVQAKAEYILNGRVDMRDPYLMDLLGPEESNIIDPNGPLVRFLQSLSGGTG